MPTRLLGHSFAASVRTQAKLDGERSIRRKTNDRRGGRNRIAGRGAIDKGHRREQRQTPRRFSFRFRSSIGRCRAGTAQDAQVFLGQRRADSGLHNVGTEFAQRKRFREGFLRRSDIAEFQIQ